MKTNVSIKFNSIEEYRVIEKKLEEMGYVNDKKWNEKILSNSSTHVVIYDHKFFEVHSHRGIGISKTYNNLEEFLNN